MTDRRKRTLHNGPIHYTRETLPPLSPGAKKILERVNAQAKAWRESPEGKATPARAKEALKKGGFEGRRDFIGIMLGAKGYE